MVSFEEIIDLVDEYVGSVDPRHAILLYGEWGSGKSRFVRGELKERLEMADNPVVMVYTTAAGCKSANDLMERLLTAYINELAGIEAHKDDKRWQKLLTVAKNAGIAYLSNKLKDIEGEIGFTFSPTAENMLSLALPKRSLIVIDDLERRAQESSQADDMLLSILCKLVDEQKHRVMLVANSIDAVSDEVKEKIVWQRIEFAPEPAALIDDILGDATTAYPNNLDMKKQLLHAQQLTGKCNARQLIRIKPLIYSMGECAFFREESIDIATKRATLLDVLHVALESSDGSRLNERDEDSDLSTVYEADEHRRKGLSLGFITKFFNGGTLLAPLEINNVLMRFAEKYHPQTQEEQDALRSIDLIQGMAFEDEDGYRCLKKILQALSHGKMHPENIPRALYAVDLLVEIGIATQADYQNAVESSKRILLDDVARSYSAIHNNSIEWQLYSNSTQNTTAYSQNIKLLRDLVIAQNQKNVYARMTNGVSEPDEHSGAQIAQNADAWNGADPIGLTSISPSELCRHIENGNACSISQLHQQIRRMHDRVTPLMEKENRTIVKNWDEELLSHIENINPTSKAGAHHIKSLCAFLNEKKQYL